MLKFLLPVLVMTSASFGQQCTRERLRVMNSKNEKCHTHFSCNKHNQVIEVDCPHGLFWNKDKFFCDFATNCEVGEEDLEVLRPPEERFIYLTFDDGPWIGTTEVLDVLKEEGIKATFFLNTDKMFDMKLENKHWTNKEGQQNLIREIEEGHVLADHSYGHMAQNILNRIGMKYQDSEKDATYFGDMNFVKIEELMKEANISEEKQKQVRDTFHRYARMPYTNNWRIKEFRYDCIKCTQPALSGLNGVLTSDVLRNEYDTNVIGWDQEWEVDWTSHNRCGHSFGATGLLMRLLTVPTRLQDKIVILTHEFLYFPKGGNRCKAKDLAQLKLFLNYAKRLGYKFRTIDTYLTDKPGGAQE